MGISIIEGGVPVRLDGRMWSFDSTIRPFGPTAYVGVDFDDPVEVWRTQRSVRTVIGFLARNIAQVALHAFTMDRSGDRQRMDAADPLPLLLSRPSPTSTWYEFSHTMVVDVCLWDRFAARIEQGSDGRVRLVRMPPAKWRFVRDDFDQPTAVELIDGNGDGHRVPLDFLLWVDGYPLPDQGLSSPLSTLADLLAEERESSKYRRELWESGARMPGWIERPPNSPWSTTARDNFRAGWQEYASGGLRAGRTPILEDGMQYHALPGGITPEAAQQLEARKLSIAETAAAFFVPPMFVGVLDNANYSNVVAYREVLYSDTLGTWFQQLSQAFNARLLTHELVEADGAFVEFNVAEKLRMSFDEQARIFQTTTGGPIMTRNEARRRMNLPALEGADELIVPLNVTEGGQASPTDSVKDRDG